MHQTGAVVCAPAHGPTSGAGRRRHLLLHSACPPTRVRAACQTARAPPDNAPTAHAAAVPTQRETGSAAVYCQVIEKSNSSDPENDVICMHPVHRILNALGRLTIAAWFLVSTQSARKKLRHLKATAIESPQRMLPWPSVVRKHTDRPTFRRRKSSSHVQAWLPVRQSARKTLQKP